LGDNVKEKEKIAQKIVNDFISESASLALGSGSTVFYIGKQLVDQKTTIKGLITNNVHLLWYLSRHPPAYQCKSTAGQLDSKYQELVGKDAAKSFNDFKASLVIVSFAFLTPDLCLGTWEDSETPVVEELLTIGRHTRTVIIAMDHSKINPPSGTAMIRLKERSVEDRSKYRFVVDNNLRDDQRETLRGMTELGITVEYVNNEEIL
jgi:DeoR/GlpR family transcriptional regulator of sugar metabolism